MTVLRSMGRKGLLASYGPIVACRVPSLTHYQHKLTAVKAQLTRRPRELRGLFPEINIRQ